MLWNSPKTQEGGAREPRIGQPQSSEEYAIWSEHFPDPGAPSTHVVVYHWEDSPNRLAPRRLIIDCPPKTEAGKVPVPITPEPPPANEARRKELAAMGRLDLKTAYEIAGLGTLTEKMNATKAIAAILEAEATATAT